MNTLKIHLHYLLCREPDVSSDQAVAVVLLGPQVVAKGSLLEPALSLAQPDGNEKCNILSIDGSNNHLESQGLLWPLLRNTFLQQF